MVRVLVRGWGPDNEFVWIWRLAGYWAFAFWVMVGLVVANWCDVEGLRRGVVVGIVGGLWGVGWIVTTEYVKKWAWENVKRIWYWVIVDEILGMVRGQTRRARRQN